MKQWVKLDTGINNDPKMGSLTWAHRGIWSAVLALAGYIDDRDEDEAETGRLGSLQDVAWMIRCDTQTFTLALAEYESRGMIHQDPEGLLTVTNYAKRYGRPPSARPSAVAERVQRHREQAQQEANEEPDECNDVTSSCNVVTPSCNEDVTTLEQNRSRTDQEQEQEQTTTDPEERATGPPAAAAAVVDLLLSAGLQKDVALLLAPATTATNMRAYIAHTKSKKGASIKNPAGWIRYQIENGIPPPFVDGDGRSWARVEGVLS